MRFYIIAVCLIASVPVRVSAEWINIGGSSTDTLSIDPNTIKRVSGSVRSAWFQFTKKPGVIAKAASVKAFHRIDCSEETTAIVSSVSYDKAGNVLQSRTNIVELLQWEPAPPGTLAATMLSVVCKFENPQ